MRNYVMNLNLKQIENSLINCTAERSHATHWNSKFCKSYSTNNRTIDICLSVLYSYIKKLKKKLKQMQNKQTKNHTFIVNKIQKKKSKLKKKPQVKLYLVSQWAFMFLRQIQFTSNRLKQKLRKEIFGKRLWNEWTLRKNIK